jgi:hypothetical protein
LECKGATEGEHGEQLKQLTDCVPIEQAMQTIVSGGTLKTRSEAAKPSRAPTAWSSGRQ